MIKKIVIGSFILIGVFAFCFWASFIKRQPNNKMLNMCLKNSRLEIQTEQSAKYISVDTRASEDTMFINVYTTTVFNPFAEKVWRRFINVDPNIKYLGFNNQTIPISRFAKRQHY